MSLNADSSFLVLSDSLGSIHFVLTETCQIVFSQDLKFLAKDGEEDLECTTLQLFPDGDKESLIVFFKGVAVRFYNIDTKAVKEAIQRQDASAAVQVCVRTA
jgi:hypothetical protein